VGIFREGFVEVKYHGVVSIKGSAGALPVILLKDAAERTMAIPLANLESDLIRHTLGGSNEGPQPYRALIACLGKLGAALGDVRIRYSSEFDLPTQLVLHLASGQEIEVAVSCGDGIAYAQIAQIPIYVAEELMSAVGARAGEAGMTQNSSTC
jgi:bifunctional DNase/RNase